LQGLLFLRLGADNELFHAAAFGHVHDPHDQAVSNFLRKILRPLDFVI
jgi:hypothetical protein